MKYIPRYSIVIPVYNAEKTLERCINSVLKQTYCNFELLLIDDGSTDQSGIICKNYCDEDVRIRYYYQNNCGVSVARNQGIENSQGDYLIFIDSDDKIPDDFLEKYENIKKSHDDRCWYMCGIQISMGEEERLDSILYFGKKQMEQVQKADIIKIFQKGLFNSPCNKLYRCRCLKEKNIRMANGINIAEDLLFNIRYLEEAGIEKICILNNNLYHYIREEKESLDSRYHSNYFEIHKGIYARFWEDCKKWNAPQKDYKLFYRRYWNMIEGAIANERRAYEGRTDWKMVRAVNEILRCPETKKCLNIIGDELSSKKRLFYSLGSYELILVMEKLKKQIECFTIKNQQKKLLRKYNIQKNRKNIVIIGTPNHYNLGDFAIGLAEKKLMSEIYCNRNIFDITMADIKKELAILRCILTSEDIIILTGGGNLGNQYMEDETIRRAVIQTLDFVRIVLFPQTLYFTEDIKGIHESRMTQSIYRRHNSLFLMARDQTSYQKMKDLLPNQKVFLMPDVVLTLIIERHFQENRAGALLCMRSDNESVGCNEQQLIKILKEKNYQVEYIDTAVDSVRGNSSNRLVLLQDLLRKIQSAEVMITDRLHGMIFCAITETTCIAIGGNYHKLRDTYQWVKDLPYIKYINSSQIEEIEGMLYEQPKNISNIFSGNKYINMYIKFFRDEFGEDNGEN